MKKIKKTDKGNTSNSNYSKLKNKIVWGSIILALIAAVPFYKSFTNTETESIKPGHAEPGFTKNGQLTFIENNTGNPIKLIDIEVASTDAQRAQGLMWRSSLPENAGMLFIFDREEPLSFWMKNTFIPLDIIFVNRSFKIISIVENTIPFSEASVQSGGPAKYVVEVNAGFCYRHEIAKGDKISFELTN